MLKRESITIMYLFLIMYFITTISFAFLSLSLGLSANYVMSIYYIRYTLFITDKLTHKIILGIQTVFTEPTAGIFHSNIDKLTFNLSKTWTFSLRAFQNYSRRSNNKMVTGVSNYCYLFLVRISSDKIGKWSLSGITA